jgi:hypothetical protein
MMSIAVLAVASLVATSVAAAAVTRVRRGGLASLAGQAAAVKNQSLSQLESYLPPPTVEAFQLKTAREIIDGGLRTMQSRILACGCAITTGTVMHSLVAPRAGLVLREIADDVRETAGREDYQFAGISLTLTEPDPTLNRRQIRLALTFPEAPADGQRPSAAAAAAAGKTRVMELPDEGSAPQVGNWNGLDYRQTRVESLAEAEPAWFLMLGDGRSYKLPCDRDVVVGAGGSCDIQLTQDTVSDRHVLLRASQKPRSLTIEDLGSTNGTTVDGTALPAHRARTIKGDAKLQLGTAVAVRLLLRAENSPASS